MAVQLARPNRFIGVAICLCLVLLLVLAYNRGALRLGNGNRHSNFVVSISEGNPQPPDDLLRQNSFWRNLFSEDASSVPVDNEEFFGVMLDAGSTGTRVHVFHFQNGPKGEPPLLIAEVFNQSQHGLAEFADSLDEGADMIRSLLDIALSAVPMNLWSSTPLALKATAGLRLMHEDKANALLNKVYDVFVECPLHTEARNATVSIIDGVHEGEFMWFTVNFLRGVLGSSNHDNTVGVLDLGGGSTQITFAPRLQETIQKGIPLGLIKNFVFMDDSFQLYTHSYLGLGLKAARLGIITLESQKKTSQLDSKTFSTVCLPPGAVVSWEFGGLSYETRSSISPLSSSSNMFNICSEIIMVFMEHKIFQASEIINRSFYASSYFIGKGVESGLIGSEFGDVVRVKDFAKIAETVCGAYDKNKPFLCMDLVYINTLLVFGYRFNGEAELVLNEDIRGFEISWALGATVIDLLHKHWDHVS